MPSSNYSFTQNVLSDIQVPAKGILSHTLYNDDQAKIVLFGFAAGEDFWILTRRDKALSLACRLMEEFSKLAEANAVISAVRKAP